MKILRSWQCYFLSILAVPSFADSSIAVDDLSLMIYGASVHSQCTESQSGNGKPCDFSYWNPGLGLDWAFGGTVISVNHGKIMNIPVNKGFPEPSKGTPDPSRTSLFCV